MSAFVVDSTHIDLLLTAGLRYATEEHGGALFWDGPPTRGLSTLNADEIGAMLLAENQASVNFRYSEDGEAPAYRMAWTPFTPNPATVVKALRCLEYQSCEHPGWEASEAKRFCDALRYRMVLLLTRHDDTWHVDYGQLDVLAERAKVTGDALALDEVASALREADWSPATMNAVADLVRATGRTLD